MKTIAMLAGGPLAIAAAGCGDEHSKEEFANHKACVDYELESSGAHAAMAACDELFAITHASRAACLSEHAADVTAGVPQASVDGHCADKFP